MARRAALVDLFEQVKDLLRSAAGFDGGRGRFTQVIQGGLNSALVQLLTTMQRFGAGFSCDKSGCGPPGETPVGDQALCPDWLWKE